MINRTSIAAALLVVLALLAGCTGQNPETAPGDGPARKSPDLTSIGGISKALGCEATKEEAPEFGDEEGALEISEAWMCGQDLLFKVKDNETAETFLGFMGLSSGAYLNKVGDQGWIIASQSAEDLSAAEQKLGLEPRPSGEPMDTPPSEGSSAGFEGTAAFGEKIAYPDGVEVEVTSAKRAELTAQEAKDAEEYYDVQDAKAGNPYWTLTIRIKNGSKVKLDSFATAQIYIGEDGTQAEQWPTDGSDIEGAILPGKAKTGNRAWLVPDGEEAILEYSFDVGEHETAYFTGVLKEF